MNLFLKRGTQAVAIAVCFFIAAASLPSETFAARKTNVTKKVSKKSARKSTRKSKRKSLRKSVRKLRLKKTKRKRSRKRKSAYVGNRSRRISLRAPWKCVPGRLKSVISQVSRKFGPVVINSTHRSRRHNRRVGGKRRSYHIGCRAVDFRVRGRTRGLSRWLARHPKVGGWKRYRSGFYHIDIGPKRTW